MSPSEAEAIREAVEALGGVASRMEGMMSGADPNLARDLIKFAGETRLLAGETAAWFPCGDSSGGPNPGSLRSIRHDARNRLNHLFGIAQLIRIGGPPVEVGALIDEGVACLEICLAAIGRIPAGSEAPQPPADPTASAPPPSPVSTPPGEGLGSLLIADDDAENREILRRLLEPKGYTLSFAENGVEAIAKMEKNDYDAVLLDIQMPEMDGFEVLARLRETGQLRHTPVIVVTGLQEEQDAVRCIEIGAEDFLSRPIRPALLMARLNASLEKKRLREKVFEQHFTRDLARELARNPDPMKMQARQAEVSVMFCDIRGFSSVSERLGPSQTIAWLGGVMGEFSSIVIDNGGVLVDYTGDELLAMWGAPNEQPNHAELACRSALEILGSLPALNETWKPVVGAETVVGIGINSGEALVGNVGTHRKFKYGPLGTVVNLASRVQGATKYLKTPLLLTGETVQRLPAGFFTRRLCRVRVRNIEAPVDLHELDRPEENPGREVLRQLYEEALAAFERGDFEPAEAKVARFLRDAPTDGAARLLQARLLEAQTSGEGAFDPVWTLPGK